MQRAGGDLLFGTMYRENVLDKAVCAVRDCFQDTFGYPVFAVNVTKTNLCFKRRQSDAKIKVFINDTGKMVKYIRSREENSQNHFKAFDFPFKVKYEDLTGFGYTDEESVWEASWDTWSRMLSTYVDNWTSEDAKILNDMMRPMRNTRNISYHEDVIQNYDEVFEALRQAGMGGYIRSRS